MFWCFDGCVVGCDGIMIVGDCVILVDVVVIKRMWVGEVFECCVVGVVV